MECSIADCEKPRRSSRALVCEMHYYRYRRTGHYGVQQIQSKAPKRQCSEAQCPNVEEGRRGLCSKHATRQRRHGSASAFVEIQDRNLPAGKDHHAWVDTPTYENAHQRLRRARGSASEHACVDCGGSAGQWSYTHDDPNELVGEKGGQVMPYSMDPEYYVPRCISCHKRFDLARFQRADRG